MNLLLAFSPFIVFVVAERLAGMQIGLGVAALVCAGLLAPLIGEQWSLADVRLRVDAGLLLIVLLSMVLGRPFSPRGGKDLNRLTASHPSAHTTTGR